MVTLCYQDFKDTFVCNTQQDHQADQEDPSCVIRISKILLYAIHNLAHTLVPRTMLCYQDFKDTFVCNTQHVSCYIFNFTVVLSGFQRYFCMQYTTDRCGNFGTYCCVIRISMNNLKDIAGIISYDIADYGMHLSRKQLFRQFLQQGKFDKQNENLPL